MGGLGKGSSDNCQELREITSIHSSQRKELQIYLYDPIELPYDSFYWPIIILIEAVVNSACSAIITTPLPWSPLGMIIWELACLLAALSEPGKLSIPNLPAYYA